MAQCYLAIPATSAPSERVFSKCKAIVGPQRASLSSESIEHLLCLKEWYRTIATILEQDNKIIRLSNKILDVEEEAAKTQRQLSNKISDVKEEAARTQRQLSNEIYSIKEELRKAKEKAAKSKNMNVVYNFVHSVERILCHCLFGSFFNGTITQALNSGEIKWPEVQAVLKCQDINKECLLKTIHKIKGQRLEYGHTSKSTAMELDLSECLIPIASEHFSLHRNKIDVLQKLLAWILPELPASATLKDLKTEA
ncbi:hypothetical protein PCANC_09345 [Puccinia coronata f. sp. avenae]|uniref:HAT C-terminal dimerisation domain-containing protein n=1 Tax=Puccinia coronata f. sp. avenae TaxID=200324 RepID=A0A2N5URS1_9BASI|nr:hypothetical protein PCANC_09345 [Puccinia coronata f. sp. avenae]